MADIEVGMHLADDADDDGPRDAARAGVIKAGASYHHISPTERRRLEAAAVASRRTGAAILVHTEIGTAGHEILDLLEGAGVRRRTGSCSRTSTATRTSSCTRRSRRAA